MAGKSALFTMVYNEPLFMPIFLGYYSQFFAPEDIYVYDHGSTDGSTLGDGFVRVPVDHSVNDNIFRLEARQAQQRELLERYDVVLTADVDEIIAPDPATGNLRDYIDRFDADFVNCAGYEVLHMKDQEPALSLDRPILEQRGHWYRNPGYDKPLLATAPIPWSPGLHTRTDNRREVDPSLRLIHLHRMDYGICLERHRAYRGRETAQSDLDTGREYQNRIVEEPAFGQWFYEDSCFGLPINPEPIPETWRGIV
jgi:hypothetical protein